MSVCMYVRMYVCMSVCMSPKKLEILKKCIRVALGSRGGLGKGQGILYGDPLRVWLLGGVVLRGCGRKGVWPRRRF